MTWPAVGVMAKVDAPAEEIVLPLMVISSTVRVVRVPS